MTIEELPEVLEVADIQFFLGISQSAAYNLVKSKVFHIVKIGRIYKIPKKAFVEWLGSREQEKTPSERLNSNAVVKKRAFVIRETNGKTYPYDWIAKKIEEYAKDTYGLDVTVSFPNLKGGPYHKKREPL